MIVRVVASLALMALSTQAFASAASDLDAIEKRLESCIDKDESTIGMKACASAALDAADKILNKVYQASVDKLKLTSTADDKEKLDRLIASERAWVAYKDKECRLQGIEMLGGTGEGLTIGLCVYTMTKERAKTLDAFFAEK